MSTLSSFYVSYLSAFCRKFALFLGKSQLSVLFTFKVHGAVVDLHFLSHQPDACLHCKTTGIMVSALRSVLVCFIVFVGIHCAYP